MEVGLAPFHDTPTMTSGRKGSRATKEVEEGPNSLSPVHWLMKNCLNLDGHTIASLAKTDPSCFDIKSSLGRSPIHWLFAFNRKIRGDVIVALHSISEEILEELDEDGMTPLDLYYKINPKSEFSFEDRVTRALCARGGVFGLDALGRCTTARADIELMGNYRVLLNGNPYEVSTYAPLLWLPIEISD